ncbi:unnamed protein product [Polarella glacialis]|uniref:Uncharacterized protein n=2 Tax=Polarella glacialis TaxID=89957 RepID=A0A813I7T1_POLGL|nr:unnamed protein product [Polarella glacialis]
MAMLRLGGFGDAMYTMKGEMLKEDYDAGVLAGFEAALVIYQLAFVDMQKVIEGVVYPMLRTGYQVAGGVGLPEGGLPGGGGGATSAGGAGRSIGEEVNSVAREAEKVRGEDETNKGKVESRNGLEKCCFSMSNTMNEEKLKDQFETVDKEKDEFENKQKEIEGVVYPMLKTGYQAAGGVGLTEGGLPGGGGGATSAGGAGSSTVEEANSVVREAEKVRGEDETNRRKVESRNGLAKCCFTMRNTMTEEKLRDKFEAVDKEKDEFENEQRRLKAAGGVGLPEGGLPGGGGGATSAGGAGSSTGEEVNSVAREAEKVRGEDETNKGKEKDEFENKHKEIEGVDEVENKQTEIEGVVYPMLRKGYQAAGKVGLPQGGLSGGGGGATSAGGAGSSTVEEANDEAREAEKVRGEDEINKGKVESRNGLEKCCFTMRKTMNEEKLRDKFEAVDETALQETGLVNLSATNRTGER